MENVENSEHSKPVSVECGVRPIPPRPLKKGTLECPMDGEVLHFEVFGGMRIIRNGEIQAKCPKCGYFWAVSA